MTLYQLMEMCWNYHKHGNTVKSYAVNEMLRGKFAQDRKIYTYFSHSYDRTSIDRSIDSEKKKCQANIQVKVRLGEVKSFTAKET